MCVYHSSRCMQAKVLLALQHLPATPVWHVHSACPVLDIMARTALWQLSLPLAIALRQHATALDSRSCLQVGSWCEASIYSCRRHVRKVVQAT